MHILTIQRSPQAVKASARCCLWCSYGYSIATLGRLALKTTVLATRNPACLYRAPASGHGSRSESYKWSCLLPGHKLAVTTQQQQASAHGMRVTHATCPYSSYASCHMLTNNSCTVRRTMGSRARHSCSMATEFNRLACKQHIPT